MDELIFQDPYWYGAVGMMDDLLTGISPPASDLLLEVWDTWVVMSRVHEQ